MAIDRAGDRKVVVPDLRGMDLSSNPLAGLTRRRKLTMWLVYADLVTHDIGNMVGMLSPGSFLSVNLTFSEMGLKTAS